MSKVHLEPCPFCGGPITQYDLGTKHDKTVSLETWCDSCGANVRIRVPIIYSKSKGVVSSEFADADAVDVWNRRADAVKRKRGKWREDMMWLTAQGYSCSECNCFTTNPSMFCPGCGADMRELPYEGATEGGN